MRVTWEDVVKYAIDLGFRRAGWGSRIEGYTFILAPDSGAVKVTNADLRSFETVLSYHEAMSWLGRNTWGRA